MRSSGHWFDDPHGLWLLTALAPLVALYLLKVRRQRVRVSSIRLWRAAGHELLARHPLRRLLPEIPLLLEATAVVLSAVAIAGPSCGRMDARADHVVFVVDVGVSMGARDGAANRLDTARRAVTRELKALGEGAEAMILAAAHEPRATTGFERDLRRLDAAARSLEVREEPADLGAAIALARSRLAALGGTRSIVVITDPGGEVPAAAEVPIRVVRVGAPADNVAILRVDLRRAKEPGTGRERATALALLANFGKSTEERFVSLRRRDQREPIASRRVQLPPGDHVPVTLAFDVAEPDTGTGVVVELSPEDALSADDRAVALVPPGPKLPVVVSPPRADPWLRRALSADPAVDLVEVEKDAIGSDRIPAGALVVTVGFCPAAAPAGDLLVVNPPEGACLGLPVGERVAHPLVTSWSDRDARLRFVSPGELRVGAARRVGVSPRAALVTAQDTALVADLGLTGRNGTLVAFDLADSTWPLQASFVLFVRNVTEAARTARALRVSTPAHTGDILRLPLRDASGELVLRGPEGDTELRVTEGVAVAAPPARTGFHDAISKRTGRAVATAAVNLASPEESDLRRVPKEGAAVDVSPRGAAAPLPRASFLVALAALLAITGEALWLTRGRHLARALTPAAKTLLVGLVTSTTLLVGYALLVRSGVIADRLLRLEHPLAALSVLVPMAILTAGIRRGRTSGGRETAVKALLGLAALTAALAAADPHLGTALDRMALLVAVDRSRSTDLVPDVASRTAFEVTAATRGMRADDRIGVVAFGSDAALEEPLRARADPRPPQRTFVGRDATDLAAGIRRALAEAPADAATRIVVVSDGAATRGDTTGAALAATLAGIPVDVVPLEPRAVPSVRVEAVRAPTTADVGETLDLRVTTRSTSDAEVRVELSLDGEVRKVGTQRIVAGEDVFWIREQATEAGLHRYDVRLVAGGSAEDALPDDNQGTAFVQVLGRSRALVLEGDAAGGDALREALSAAAFDVDMASATQAPASVDALARYDLVVLSDIPAHDFSADQLADFGAHVERLGGGLLLLGGDRSLGPGGYARTPVEDVSPVTFEIRNERRRARLSEVIAIDTSGSMAAAAGGRTKLELANEAAARSASLLGSMDRLGVAHVDTAVRWTLPLSNVTDPVAIGRKIRAVSPGGGGIYVDLTLEAAYAALEREAVDLKHLLLFADGGDAEERERAPGLADRALARGITTSVVALGRGHDVAGLEALSRRGKGRFYLIEDAGRLPAVFAQETTIAAGNSIEEVDFRPAPGAPIPATRGIDFAEAPPLHGYVVTQPKPRAEVALRAPEGDPLLATWSVGVGRSAAFTSDFKGRWGAAWTHWPSGARLFAQLGRHLARGVRDALVELESSARGGALLVRASAARDDGAADSSRALAARISGPGGFARTVPLSPDGPGSYAATVPLSRAGAYVTAVTDETTSALVGTTSAVLSIGEELEPRGADPAELRRVARLTGGRVRTGLAGIFEDRPEPRRAYRSLLPLLMLASALSLVGSAGARRLSFPVPQWLARRRRRPIASPHAPPKTPAATEPHPAAEPDLRAHPGDDAVDDVTRPEPTPPTTTAEVLLERRRRRE